MRESCYFESPSPDSVACQNGINKSEANNRISDYGYLTLSNLHPSGISRGILQDNEMFCEDRELPKIDSDAYLVSFREALWVQDCTLEFPIDKRADLDIKFFELLKVQKRISPLVSINHLL